MAVSYIPVLGADGNTYFIAITPIVVNGVTVYVQSSMSADPVSGAIASVSAPGTSGVNASAIQGVAGGVPLNVSVAPAGSTTANVSAVLVGTANTLIIPTANLARVGSMIYNEGPSVIYFVHGPTAAVAPDGGGTYSSQLSPGERPFINTIPYYGVVAAVVGAGATPSWVLVTEFI